MALNMKANSKTMKLMVKVERSTPMENTTMVNSKMTNAKVTEYTKILMVAAMKENGWMTSNMARVKKSGTMGLKPTKETSSWEKSTAKANSPGQMALSTRETS